MKNYNSNLFSNTNSIAPYVNNDTSVNPFIKSVYYIVNFINYNQIIDEKTIEFTNIERDVQKRTVIPNPGFLKGTFIMTENFDDTLEEFLDYM